MKTKQLTIGRLIEDEVRKQNIDITKFARQIHTSRGNVYNIFERNDFKIEQLLLISEALSHNFFKDIAENIDLAKPVPIEDEELERLRAVNQFMEVVPKVFQKLGYDVSLVLGVKNPDEENLPLPDFILSDYNFTFTIGQTFEELSNGFYKNGITFIHPSSDCPVKMVEYVNNIDGIQYLDIAIDYKTEEEWEETIRFAMEEIKTSYLPHTWHYLEEIRNINK